MLLRVLLKLLAIVLFIIFPSFGIFHHSPHKKPVHHGPREDGLVTLMPPYTGWRGSSEKPVPRIHLASAVAAVCMQAGIKYDIETSYQNIGASGWQCIAPVIEDQPPEQALDEILTPAGLTYTIENNLLVLTRMDYEVEPVKRLVTLESPYDMARPPDSTVPKVTVQFAVIAISRQAGIEYDWDKSVEGAGMACQRYITPSIAMEPWDEAMEEILAPLDLTYTLEDGVVSLKVSGDAAVAVVMPSQQNFPAKEKKQVSLKPPFTGWNPNKRDADDVIALQHAVDAVCRQAGLTFDFERSYHNVGPLCESRISPFIDKEPWDEAMDEMLGPFDLSYTIQGNHVVLITG